PNKLKTIINFWAIKNWIKRHNVEYSRNHFVIRYQHQKETLKNQLEKRHELARFIVELLYERSTASISEGDLNSDEVLVAFSVHELKVAYEVSQSLFRFNITIEDIEDTLFYLSRIEAIKIEGGFLAVYNQLTIE